MPLLSLPQDLILEILTLLRPEHVLILGQTCRVLHEYTLNDYVWHRLADECDLPLDIDPGFDDYLPGPILKAIVTDALRVDLNWRKPTSRLKKLTPVDPDTVNVSQIQFISSKWLLVLRRSASAASLSVWRVADTPSPYRVAFLDIPASAVPLKFSAAIQKGSENASIALISSIKPSGTSLSVYSVSLKTKTDDGFMPPRPLFTIHKPDGRFYEVHICRDIVAVAIYINHMLSAAAYRILFLNRVTGAQCLVDPCLPDQYTQLHFKLCTQHLVFAGVRNPSTLVIRIHDISHLIRDGAMFASPSATLGAPDATYETETTVVDEFEFSVDSARDLSHISLISFHALVQRQSRGEDYMFHFPLYRPVSELPSSVYPFHTHASASAEIVCLGGTGHRAVWLERRWTNDEFTLMKAIFSANGPRSVVVAPLLARHTVLPFELSTVVSLTFDEPSGRVCLAVHTGELYLLEF